MEISSRNVVDGTARSPHRAMYRAMGLEDEDISKSFVGVCHTGNEATPCNIHLPGLAEHAKKGVSEGGATPRIFSTIAVSDGIAMGHEGMKSSLVSREVIADSIELMVRAHQYDALVGIAGCDKSLPGTMMAMARLNIPSVFVYGGTIMPGMLDGKELVDVYEAVGAYDSGKISIDDLKDIEKTACPALRVVACLLWHQIFIPPHEPALDAVFSISLRSSMLIFPESYAPTASYTSTMVSSFPSSIPGIMVPPYTKTDGMFNLAIAIIVPGSDLSHPAIPTSASY